MKKFKRLLLIMLIISLSPIAIASDYNPYKKPLKNELVERKQVVIHNIEIMRNQFIPKTKLKRNCDCYEYLITNQTKNDIILKRIESPNFLSLSQSAGRALRPTFIDFIPGINIIAAVPVDLEKNRFTRPLPFDLKITPDESVRVLALTDKDDSPTVDLYFLINDKEQTIHLNEDKQNEKI